MPRERGCRRRPPLRRRTPVPPARGPGVPIPAKGRPPVIRRSANLSRVRVPEVAPIVIAATGAPTAGSRVAVVARRGDPYAAEPGVKGRVAPGDPGCRAHAKRSHDRAYCRVCSSILSTTPIWVLCRGRGGRRNRRWRYATEGVRYITTPSDQLILN